MSTDSPAKFPRSWHEHAAKSPQAQAYGEGYASERDGRVQQPHATQALPPAEPEMKAKLLRDWQLVKRARFQAADRLQRRNNASLFTLSMVALYGGLITVFVLIFKDSLTPHARSICDWISAVANWLTLTFSLTEQIKDYSGQSRALHECAQKVNDLRKHLQATPISAPQQLIPFVQAYEARIAECGPNHDPLDYEIARLQGSRTVDGRTQAQTSAKLTRLKAWSKISTYAIYTIMCGAPAIAGFAAWFFVPAVVAH
jgi:hypothetical protein